MKKLILIVLLCGLVGAFYWLAKTPKTVEVQKPVIKKVVQEKLVLGYVKKMRISCYTLVEFASKGITADKYKIQDSDGWYKKGKLFVASNTLPFGTKVKIEGFGDNIFTVKDRFLSGWGYADLDIYWGDNVSAYRDCVNWGKKTLDVLILQSRPNPFVK